MKHGMNPELGLTILRIVLGVIFIAHGWPKVGSMAGTADFLGGLGVPAPLVAAWAITVLELCGGLLLLIGFLVTPVALLLTAHMLMGIVLVHAANGFYVIGLGAGGIEFNLILAAAAMMLVFGGPGLAALDSRKQP
ncbi:MAG: DoxX family protein [Gemmatimonadota bacterium]|nr:DoxX family protein [Gemmatimonadota bacterium]